MLAKLTYRMLSEVDARSLARFCWAVGFRGMLGINRFKRKKRRGERTVPPFLFLSITNACNLNCQGCWVTQTNPPTHLSLETMDRIVTQGKRQGNYFYGLLGGEPFMHPRLFDLLEKHPDCFFQVLTNGTLITRQIAAKMRALGNVTPLISIEGLEEESDRRRRGTDVYSRSMKGLENCRNEKLLIGVASSVCRSNITELATDQFLSRLIAKGVHYMWYYLYRPCGADPAPEMVLHPEEVTQLRRFIVEKRCTAPILIIDAYWDHRGKALCPAAVGISHHINPAGDIEPCPILQYARDRMNSDTDLMKLFRESTFLHDFQEFASKATPGCVLLEKPGQLREFLIEHDARDTSGRDTGLQELADLKPSCSHNMAGREIPEKGLLYKFAKKNWFFGFGTYG